MLPAGPTLRYDVLDVFTDRAFAGNALAVVHGAEDLSDEQMQAIAREFNLSETAFALPPTSAGADYRVRIFTPLTELPFAGLPSIGTAWLLAAIGRVPRGGAVQQSEGGLHGVHTEEHGARLNGGEPGVGQHLDPLPLAIASGLLKSDVDNVVSAGVAGAGMDFSFLPVREDSVARAVPKPAEIAERTVGRGLVPVAFDSERRTARVRMFRASGGEDPATGAAALALGVWLVDRGLLPGNGESSYRVSQGAEVGRPSILDGRVLASDGRAVSVSVGGQVVPVASGRIRVS